MAPTTHAPHTHFAWAIGIALCTFACFANTLDGGFLNWDDQRNLVDNPWYRGLGATQLGWMFTTFHMGPYQPLSWLSLAIDHALWGMQPKGYHLTNVALHALNAALAYALMLTLLDRGGRAPMRHVAAATGALCFALHPLRVESVAWITERRDVLSLAFLLIAVLGYCHRRQTLALTAYALALLAKASGMTLPLVLLIIDAARPEPHAQDSLRARVVAKWPYFALALVAAVLAWHGQREAGTTRAWSDHGFFARVVQSAWGLTFYLAKTLAPVRLSPLYELDSRFGPWQWPYWAGALAAIVITLGLFATRRRARGAWLAWSSFAILAAPTLGLAQSGPQIAADRYTYLACVPFAVLLSAMMMPLARPKIVMPIVIAGIATLGWLTTKQAKVWHDSVSLWQHALALDDASFLARANLGFAYEARKDYERALPLLRRALELKPSDVRTRHTLALTLARTKDFANAITEWQRVIEIEPDHADALYSLGLASANLGRTEDAIRYYRRAVTAKPDYREAWLNLRSEYTHSGHREEANECARRLLEIDRSRSPP